MVWCGGEIMDEGGGEIEGLKDWRGRWDREMLLSFCLVLDFMDFMGVGWDGMRWE